MEVQQKVDPDAAHSQIGLQLRFVRRD